MNSWLSGFLSGVIATIVGFFLTMLWDIYKYKRDSGNRDRSVLTAIKEELISNSNILSNNLQILEHEIIILDENKSMVTPLNLLQGGFWDLVKINLPSQLTKGDALLKIRRVALLTEEINETIKSRENYRINNGAMSNYSGRLKIYDQMLIGYLQDLATLFSEMQQEAWFK